MIMRRVILRLWVLIEARDKPIKMTDFEWPVTEPMLPNKSRPAPRAEGR